MIVFRKVTKRFGRHRVLNEVSFQIRSNEFVVLTGNSGSGKSTIVSLLLGALKPDSGSVEVDDLLVSEMNDNTLQLYRRRLGVVFQDYKLLPRKTVFENIAFVLEVCDTPRDEIAKRVSEILQKVGLFPFQDHFPEELSGGERQRLAIARALAHSPKFLIADEPTGNLDEGNVRGIMDLFKKLHYEGMTVLLTTHDPLVQQLAPGRTLTVCDGSIS